MSGKKTVAKTEQPAETSFNPAGNRRYYAQLSAGISATPLVQFQAIQQNKIKKSPRIVLQKKEQEKITILPSIAQLQENKTGLPDQLKSGIESLSGFSMDDVRVFKNSPKPAQLQAHAYAQGSDIHLGPGQEQHLPHEAWHVVQQKQGRVKPTVQLKERVPVNDDEGLETEADVMGKKAAQLKTFSPLTLNYQQAIYDTVQRQPAWKPGNHPDNLLDDFVDELDNLVQRGAQIALQDPSALPGTDGYTALWKDTVDILVGLRDNDPQVDANAPASRIARRLQNARYGYAVEAYASGHINELSATLPNGYTYALQAGRGATRPDIVVKNAAGADVAWFDITSANSMGHIDLKTGAGWQTKPYVAEITYPPLDVTGLRTGRTSIGQRVATKNAYLRRQDQWNEFVRDKKQSFLYKYRRLFKHRDEPYQSKKVLQDNTKAALTDLFGVQFTDLPAKNLLRSFDLNVKDYGYYSGGARADGDAFLLGLYQQREEEEV